MQGPRIMLPPGAMLIRAAAGSELLQKVGLTGCAGELCHKATLRTNVQYKQRRNRGPWGCLGPNRVHQAKMASPDSVDLVKRWPNTLGRWAYRSERCCLSVLAKKTR